MSEPLDLEPIKARLEALDHPVAILPEEHRMMLGDVGELIAEVERLRANFDALDLMYAHHLAACPTPVIHRERRGTACSSHYTRPLPYP